MRRTLLLLTLLVGFATACSTALEDPAPSGPPRLALFLPVLENRFTDAITRGVMDEAAESGASVVVYGAQPAFDPQHQISQMIEAAESGQYDAFILYPVDGEAVVNVVERTVASGVQMVVVDVVVGGDPHSIEPCCGINTYVGTTGFRQGQWIGQMVVEACRATLPCQVGYLDGVASLTVDQDRMEGVLSVVEPQPAISIVAQQEGFYLQEAAFEAAQQMLREYPNLDVIVGLGDLMMLGAERAVLESGRWGSVRLLGTGIGEQGYEAIAKGRLHAGYAYIPYTEGRLAARAAIQAASGEPYQSSILIDEQRPPYPSSGPIITRENLYEFVPQW